MIDLLSYITTQITLSDKIKILESEVDGQKVYTIKAPKEVMGILIGKEGRTIKAIRTLAWAQATKDARGSNDRISITINLEEN